MSLSLNQTIGHLKKMMARVKDSVFPQYSDTLPEQALQDIRAELSAVASPEVASAFLERLPAVRSLVLGDVDAIAHNDPAVRSYQEIVYCYPAVTAMLYYRTAHELYLLDVPIIPRMLTEYAHGVTGIDIHPAAQIGERFAIDHGTGIVIGATSIIGNDVTLYQGVTLGAKSFSYDADGHPVDLPRHPILEDGVTVYSNASILGRITIGEGSVIGGNVWLTHSVPPRSRILQGKTQEQHFSDGAGI
ncbi:MAG: serine acetyltransferase [Bacteroidales bacterium]|nr:serine acetyltransferase [Bacteroidales bacterium]